MDAHEARALMERHCPDARLRRHCLASAAVLAALARRLGQDPGTWAVAGLLHDLDYDRTAGDMARLTPLDLALTCGETITGLVMATAMVQPDKRLASVKPKSVVKRMKETAFAASVNREHILLCERLGLPLADFAALAVAAMQGISQELGL